MVWVQFLSCCSRIVSAIFAPRMNRMKKALDDSIRFYDTVRKNRSASYRASLLFVASIYAIEARTKKVKVPGSRTTRFAVYTVYIASSTSISENLYFISFDILFVSCLPPPPSMAFHSLLSSDFIFRPDRRIWDALRAIVLFG